MAEYIEREPIIEEMQSLIDNVSRNFPKATETDLIILKGKYEAFMEYIKEQPAAVQEKRYCKMMPYEPDCRGYTNTFSCTNCQSYILLGFVSQRYDGNYCIECGAEVEDGATNG